MPVSRRSFAQSVALTAAALAIPRHLLRAADSQDDLGVFHTADAIHQEAMISSTPARVYAALTTAKQFDGIVRLSAAGKSMSLKDAPSVISKDAGGAFALFGGYITGRQIELVPNERIVQAWRAGGWPSGAFSLVTWKLTVDGAGTKLTMDHVGFPAGEAQHLAEGWRGSYFTPLAAYLAK